MKKFTDNYIATDATAEDIEQIFNYHRNALLHPEFLPMTTYDMVQAGSLLTKHGEMVARNHDGVDENGVLQPPTGMWIKVEDFMSYLRMTNGMKDIIKTNMMFSHPPIEEPKPSKKKKVKKEKK